MTLKLSNKNCQKEEEKKIKNAHKSATYKKESGKQSTDALIALP